jgi:predicted  nucleic acid-binding Zn-ribbon protein
MSDNDDLAAQDALADLVEGEQQSGLTHEQALAELSKVRREAAKHRTEKQATKAALDELQKYKDAEKTELELLKERAEKAESAAAEATRERAARAAAKAAGLDAEWADLVRGNTEDELRASAEALAERLGNAAPATTAFNTGNRAPVRAPESASAAFRAMFQ